MPLTTETIGLLTWDYGRPKGGMGRSLQHITRTLQGSVAHPHSSGKFRTGAVQRSDGTTSPDLRTIRVLSPSPIDVSDAPFLRFTHRFGGQLLFSLLLPFALARRLAREHIDRLLLPVGPGGVLLLRRPPAAVTAIVYHSYAQQSDLVPGQRWKRIFRPFERRTLGFCERIICFCSDTKDALIRAYDIDPAIIDILPHAVSPSGIHKKSEPLLCVCVARLEARKGVDVLLHAWPTILHHIPDAQLVIVGDGIERNKIDRLITQTLNVRRCASLSQHELDHLLACAAVAFCPAYLEGFGLACAEAMAAGCCVIASDTDGLRSLVKHETNGLLVLPGNSSALADAAVRVLSDADRCSSLGRAAAAHIAQACDPDRADAALRSVL